MTNTLTYDDMQEILIEADTLGYTHVMIKNGYSTFPIVGFRGSGLIYADIHHEPMSIKQIAMGMEENLGSVEVHSMDGKFTLTKAEYDDENGVLTLVSTVSADSLPAW